MASAFKNAGQQNPTTDDATADVYTAPSNGTAVLHAVYISNTNASSEADIDCLLYTSPSPRDRG